jgi:hypothetical protein
MLQMVPVALGFQHIITYPVFYGFLKIATHVGNILFQDIFNVEINKQLLHYLFGYRIIPEVIVGMVQQWLPVGGIQPFEFGMVACSSGIACRQVGGVIQHDI